MENDILRVGDTVMWKGAFGTQPPVEAKIVGMEWCQLGVKNGIRTSNIDWGKANSRQLVVDLDNGHWAYGTQLSKK